MAPTFSSVVERAHVFVGLAPGPRDDVLRALLDRLVAAGAMDEERSTTVFRAVLKRERTGTTGIGRGIALPHCKTAAVDRVIAAFGRVSGPVDFGAADGDPVTSLFLVVSPPEAADEHVSILRSVAKIARDDYASRVLGNTNDPGSLYELFGELDVRP